MEKEEFDMKDVKNKYYGMEPRIIEEFKEELKNRPYLSGKDLLNRVNSYMDSTYEDKEAWKKISGSREYRDFIMYRVVRKARELRILFTKETFTELLEYSKNSAYAIDLIDKDGSAKILIDLIKENPEYIKYVTDNLNAEKLSRIARAYERRKEHIQDRYSDEDNIIRNEEDKFYYEGDTNFFVELIGANPQILQETPMKYISARNPDIKLASLLYEKSNLSAQLADTEKQIKTNSSSKEASRL